MPHSLALELEQVATGSLPRILLAADGTLTSVLEAYADEPVQVVKLSQAFEAGDGQSPHIAIGAGEQVLSRSVLLRGMRSGINYVHAECLIRADRLPPGVLEPLVSTTTPLRTILADRRIGTFRDLVDAGVEAAGTCGRWFDVTAAAPLVTRTYRILISQEPVILITEKFPLGHTS